MAAHNKALNKAMNGGRMLRGHDPTQEVYRHFLDDDNNIIGLAIGATKGRSVQVGDRALLYEAVAKLQPLFCVFAGCGIRSLAWRCARVWFRRNNTRWLAVYRQRHSAADSYHRQIDGHHFRVHSHSVPLPQIEANTPSKSCSTNSIMIYVFYGS